MNLVYNFIILVLTFSLFWNSFSNIGNYFLNLTCLKLLRFENVMRYELLKSLLRWSVYCCCFVVTTLWNLLFDHSTLIIKMLLLFCYLVLSQVSSQRCFLNFLFLVRNFYFKSLNLIFLYVWFYRKRLFISACFSHAYTL